MATSGLLRDGRQLWCRFVHNPCSHKLKQPSTKAVLATRSHAHQQQHEFKCCPQLLAAFARVMPQQRKAYTSNSLAEAHKRSRHCESPNQSSQLGTVNQCQQVQLELPSAIRTLQRRNRHPMMQHDEKHHHDSRTGRACRQPHYMPGSHRRVRPPYAPNPTTGQTKPYIHP